MKTKVVLRTIHGSWLYGLATMQSDHDYYEIYDFMNHRYRPKKQSMQRIQDDSDEVKISLERFTDICFKGVPQALEVLYAPQEAWLIDNDWHVIADKLKLDLQNHMSTVLDTYRRTALNFFHSKTDKRRRHAFRLLINARELKESGSMHSRLHASQIKQINELTNCFYAEQQFKDMLFNIFGDINE